MPGTSIECACVGGTKGAQVCKDEGDGYDTCQCGSTSTSSSTSSSSSSGSNSSCGDGVIQASDHCDNPSSEFYCAQDCSSSSSSSSSSGDPCAGHTYYAGKYDGAPSVWSNLPGAGGLTKLDAGNAQCKALNIGADHVCDYEEVLKAQAQGELAGIPAGTTAWVQRTTVAMVKGIASPPGPGGRCNDWSYATNHISDGEYVTFDTAGQPTYHLDNDTSYDPLAPKLVPGDLECGGQMRSILCCYQACN
ncbi:Hypothetical protein A7982_01833 [Minicystis rosea]|nr:Hypothetical protein A7982_01833 [Minicystis rosea]